MVVNAMSKRVGRKQTDSIYQRKDLGSDARFMAALLKEQPQTKEELRKNAKLPEATFYKTATLLEKHKIIKRIDNTYSLFNYDPIEKQIKEALILQTRDSTHWRVTSNNLANAVGKPYPEIESLVYKIAKELGLTIVPEDGITYFYKST